MKIYFFLTTYLISIYFLNEYLKKMDLMKSNTGFVHQLFANNSVPLSGGLFIILPVLFFFYNFSFVFLFSYTFLFILGILSDLNILIKVKLRFFLQLLIVSIFVFITELQVLPTRIDIIDDNLSGTDISLIFTIFCLLILINGSNFIDGLNGLFIGYVLIIFFIIFKLDLFLELGEQKNLKEIELIYFVGILIFLYLVNLSNKLFLGDSGTYSLSFLIGVVLIKIYNLNLDISPYFIILLLWYPCFENLFSIIRKTISKKDPLEPDNLHLHHLIFIFFNKNLSFNKLNSNNLSSILINTFNFIIFYKATSDINLSYLQLSLISICILIYLLIFFLLRNSIKK